MMADVMDALGLAGKYVVRVNNRKVLDGVLATAGVSTDDQKLIVLRAIDKLDKFGPEGVKLLLGAGRKDESGDFTKGAGLAPEQIEPILAYVESGSPADGIERGSNAHVVGTINALAGLIGGSEVGLQGAQELASIFGLVSAAGFGDRVILDPSVVRGLEYYTGPVFEIELTFKVQNEKGQDVVFGSVGGGGRYDGLVSRFRREPVPATGFSIGVSRLANALKLTGNLGATEPVGPVVVLVMDKDQMAGYQAMVSELRNAGIRAEMFLGNTKNFGKQVAYADKRNAPAVIIEGSQEREGGILQVKDLIAGKQAAAAITDNAEWKAARPGQFEIKREDLVSAVQKLLSEQ
jgi:histidyl-tRNA synthetase